jgi:signal transduction histidine kinase
MSCSRFLKFINSAERSVFLFFLICFLWINLSAAEPKYTIESGLSFITNYTPGDYNAHGQNWAILRDKKGFMYFGNTDGCVLQYDGVDWRKIRVINNSIVRSLAMDSSGTIYAGAQKEIGFLVPDSSGMLRYKSILSEIPEKYRDFSDVWQIHFINNLLYFNTRKYLFRRDANGAFKVWIAKNVFHASFQPYPGQLYIHQRKTGLMVLQNDSLKLISGGELFKDDWVYSIIPLEDNKLLIAARNTGLFIYDGNKIIKFNTRAEKWLIANQVYDGIALKNGQIIFVTLRGGLVILDRKGNIIKIIDEKSGLQNERIWHIYEDEHNGLWLALNIGISHVEYPSAWSFFNETNGLEGSVHDIVRHKGRIYASTGMGIYCLQKPIKVVKNNKFVLLNGLKSQSWGLLSLIDNLLVSCNHGIFEYRSGKFNQLSKKSAWQLQRSQRDSNRIYLGLDQGVSSIYRIHGSWKEENRLPGFIANARTIAEDKQGRLWVGTIYEGACRIEFDANTNNVKEIKHFDKTHGLPSNRYNLVFPFNKDIVFGTTDGIYQFDEKKQRFSPLSYTGEYPKTSDIYTIISQDFRGNLIFNSNDKLIRMEAQNNGKFNASFKPFLRLPEISLYSIFPESNGLIWIGSPQGIFLYNPQNKRKNVQNFHTYIRRVSIFGDSIIFNGIDTQNVEIAKIPYSAKAIRFEFASPYYISEKQTHYRYRLVGFDSEWSDWSSETKKDYTNLPEGEYKFLSQARNIFGELSIPGEFPLIIKAPFYRSWWAYLLYFIVITIIIIFSVRRIIKHTREKTIIEHQKLEASRKKMEEELRSRLAADFHDELGTQITRISLFSEILKGDLTNISDTAMSYLDKISQNAENLYNETRDFIWQLDPTKDTLLDFIGRINNFSNELFSDSSVNFQLQNKVNNPQKIKLSMEIRQHLIRIFKEALHNILKYAQCKNIIFQISAIGQELEFILSDDGKGFNPQSETDGNGLVNMRSRAEKIGAFIEIDSQIKRGTEIRLRVTV